MGATGGANTPTSRAKEIETLNVHWGTITKRPLTRDRFSFYAFHAAGGLSRTPRAFYVTSSSIWPSFSWRSSLAVGPSPDRKDGVGQMNAA
jgi:hypothetical protein